MTSEKEITEESLAIDNEWKRIDKEIKDCKTLEEELTEELNAIKAKEKEYSLPKVKGNVTPEDTKALKERREAYEKRDEEMVEWQRHILYDVEEINKRSKAFNQKPLPTKIAHKQIIQPQYTSKGKRLTPLAPGAEGGSSPRKAPKGSPKAGSKGGSHPPVSPKGKAKAGSHAPPGSPKGKGGAPHSPSSPKGAGPSGFPEGGAGSGLSEKELTEESLEIDNEWKRIDRDQKDCKKLEEELAAELDAIKAKEKEYSLPKVKGNVTPEDTKALKERREAYEAKVEELVEWQRHILYDVDEINKHSKAFNQKPLPKKIAHKQIVQPQYTHKGKKLTPLPYEKGEK